MSSSVGGAEVLMPRSQPGYRKGSHRGLGWKIAGYTVVIVGVGGGIYYAARYRIASHPPVHHVIKKHVKPKPVVLPNQLVIKTTPQSQNPQLPNGAEVTSLSMLLATAGHPVSKVTLANEIAKDPAKEVVKTSTYQGKTITQILAWGNPNVGYVGNMFVAGKGYGVYNRPIYLLLKKIMPKYAANLSGQPFSSVLTKVGEKIPVVAWTTLNFQAPTYWITWKTAQGPFRATPTENTVLIVGYNKTAKTVSVDNPETGTTETVPMTPFIQSWQQLGSQAVTLKSIPVKPTKSKKKHAKKTTG